MSTLCHVEKSAQLKLINSLLTTSYFGGNCSNHLVVIRAHMLVIAIELHSIFSQFQ